MKYIHGHNAPADIEEWLRLRKSSKPEIQKEPSGVRKKSTRENIKKTLVFGR